MLTSYSLRGGRGLHEPSHSDIKGLPELKWIILPHVQRFVVEWANVTVVIVFRVASVHLWYFIVYK